jgi:hypothetical protein
VSAPRSRRQAGWRWKPGAVVVYTADNLGVTESPSATQMVADVTVGVGDTGIYLRSIAVEMRSPGWHMTKTVIDGREFYVPVHQSMFKPSTDSE